jgi:hypothetical protein
VPGLYRTQSIKRPVIGFLALLARECFAQASPFTECRDIERDVSAGKKSRKAAEEKSGWEILARKTTEN